MSEAFICDAIRTPIGRYGGALCSVRPDDLAAVVLRELARRNAGLDPGAIDDVILGCANQAGEDNRNVARMSALLAGLPLEVPGATLNRLCGSGTRRRGECRAHDPHRRGRGRDRRRRGEHEPRAVRRVQGHRPVRTRCADVRHDHRLALRQCAAQATVRRSIRCPRPARTSRRNFGVSREDQDRFALRSQQRALAAQAAGWFAREIVGVPVPAKRGETTLVSVDEHPRETSLEALARLPTPFRAGGTVTAGNSSGINDGACALLLAGPGAVKRFGLTPRARGSSAPRWPECAPRIMGMGPVAATRKLLARLGLDLADIDLIELNEAFAAQALAVMRDLGIADERRKRQCAGRRDRAWVIRSARAARVW